MATLAEYLLNDALPPRYRIRGNLDKKKLKEAMIRFASESPEKYPDSISKIKELGDEIATFEGISVGLNDIAPMYGEKAKVFSWAKKELGKSKSPKKFKETLLKVQERGMSLAKRHPGTMGLMVNSGGRGNAAQLMKAVVSPIVVKDSQGSPYPYLVHNSYSEGLTPAEYWITSNEARQEVIKGQLSTAIPGDLSKQTTNVLNDVLVTKVDCRTRNGIPMSIDDPQIIDRYTASSDSNTRGNHLITPSYVRQLKSNKIKNIIVRSPMTCLEHVGVCQKCYGLNERGTLPSMGTNMGLRSASALAEPLTQMVLASKHGVSIAKGEGDVRGLEGIRQLIEIPKIFKREAVLSRDDGRVNKIEEAPQGGKFVFVGKQEHYVPPSLQVTVTKGDKVYEGDTLSQGLANPKKLIKHKGLGVGRNYVTDKMYQFYKGDGIDIDKRHLEMLAKKNLNWVRITEPDDTGNYIPGDIVNYNVLKDKFAGMSKNHKLTKSVVGDYLGDDHLYFTAGTKITPNVYRTLKKHGLKSIKVSDKQPKFEYVVKPLEQTPLLKTDWVSRLGHRRLKDTITEGAAYGYGSKIKGLAPYPAMLFSKDFGDYGDFSPEDGDVEY